MGKKVKLEKKMYQVYYIFTYLNILSFIAIVIQYYTSLKSPISKVKSVSSLVTMTHIRDLSP